MARRVRDKARGRARARQGREQSSHGGYVAPDRLTLAEWVGESWLPMTRTRVKPSTFHSYRSNMEIHVLPALGTRGLQQLTAPMLNTLYADLLNHGGERGPLAAKTVRYIHTIVHKALDDAVNAGVLGANSAERPSRPDRTGTGPGPSSAGSHCDSPLSSNR